MEIVVNAVVDEVIEAYKGIPKVQERFGYTEPMGVYNWRSRGIPRALIADIHVDTGISIERLQAGVKSVK
jgi:hypothetical protein